MNPSLAPTRSCAGCNVKAPKHSLIRIVRTKSGDVGLDLDHKKFGRGAYICDIKCFQIASRKNRFDYKLRGQVSREDLNSIEQILESNLQIIHSTVFGD